MGCGSDPGESVLLLGFPGSSSLGYWSRVGLLPSDSDQALSPVCVWLWLMLQSWRSLPLSSLPAALVLCQHCVIYLHKAPLSS